MENWTGTKPKSTAYVDFPYSFTRMVLCIFGAMPCSWKKPYLPSGELRNSTFLYCTAVYAITWASAYYTITINKQHIKEAHPYNHYMFLVAVELSFWVVPMIITLVSWFDADDLNNTIQLWYELMDKYETVLKKPIPSCKRREIFTQSLILLAGPCIWMMIYFSFGPYLADIKFSLLCIVVNTIHLSLAHHWMGYNMVISLMADEITKHLKSCAQNNLFTFKLLEDSKHLWMMMRNITDKQSNMKGPLCFSAVQYILGALSLYGSIIVYSHTKLMGLTCINLTAVVIYTLPITFLCTTGHTTLDKMEFLFEDVFSRCSMSEFSDLARREICMIYLVKKARRANLHLQGFAEVDHALLLSGLSQMLMYVFVVNQFHQSNIS